MARTKHHKETTEESKVAVSRSRKAVESAAAFGLILVAVGIAGPFADLSVSSIRIFKWIYGAGALIYTIARLIGSTDPAESLRLRRLRRLEFWAGAAFCVGTFFWFYNEHRNEFYLNHGFGTLACLQDTIYFTLAGGVIQVLATFAISRQIKKEREGK